MRDRSDLAPIARIECAVSGGAPVAGPASSAVNDT